MHSATGTAFRAGMTEAQIEKLYTWICEATGDWEVQVRSSRAVRAIRRLEAGRTVDGIPKCADALGIPIKWMQEIAVWLGWKQRNPKGKGNAVFCSAVTRDVSEQAWDALAE